MMVRTIPHGLFSFITVLLIAHQLHCVKLHEFLHFEFPIPKQLFKQLRFVIIVIKGLSSSGDEKNSMKLT